jgi:hypothetical protein
MLSGPILKHACARGCTKKVDGLRISPCVFPSLNEMLTRTHTGRRIMKNLTGKQDNGDNHRYDFCFTYFIIV